MVVWVCFEFNGDWVSLFDSWSETHVQSIWVLVHEPVQSTWMRKEEKRTGKLIELCDFSDVKWRHVCQEPWWDRFWVLGEYQRQRLEDSDQYLWEWKHKHRQRRKIWTLVWPIWRFPWIQHPLDWFSHHVSVLLKNHMNPINFHQWNPCYSESEAACSCICFLLSLGTLMWCLCNWYSI